MDVVVTDRVEKRIVLKAPRSRVWRALTTPAEFGAWFGVDFSGVAAFTPGVTATGPILIDGYRHVMLEAHIEEVTPETVFAYRWHPNAIDPKVDYSSEPMTLVRFELSDHAGGTLLEVVESGFDRIPLARRAEAFRSNDGGWAEQMERIASYLARG